MKKNTSINITGTLSLVILSITLLFNHTAQALTPLPAGDTNITILAPLPGVVYASLEASATDKLVIINWKTASETDHNYFEVERSTDRKNFKTVALVLDGFNTTGTGKAYAFKEANGVFKQDKTVYYRLKQIGNDGIIHYSPLMQVQMRNNIIAVVPAFQAGN